MLANLEGHCTNPTKDLSMCISTLSKNLDSTFEVFNFYFCIKKVAILVQLFLKSET